MPNPLSLAIEYLRDQEKAVLVAKLHASPEYKSYLAAKQQEKIICDQVPRAYEDRVAFPLRLKQVVERCEAAMETMSGHRIGLRKVEEKLGLLEEEDTHER